MTLEEFLKQAAEKCAQVRLVPKINGGEVEFYAHFLGVDGPTVDFGVVRNTCIKLFRAAGGKPGEWRNQVPEVTEDEWCTAVEKLLDVPGLIDRNMNSAEFLDAQNMLLALVKQKRMATP